MEFRLLRADEINIRVNDIRKVKYGENEIIRASFLLYKDARCDMNILDETVGAFNWQKRYTRDNANCIVSIYDENKKEWIEKEDTGTESFSEAEKGLASDSFKRACFNWGIGRELYTAPNIVIPLNEKEYGVKTDPKDPQKEKYTCYLNLAVKEIEYENKAITKLVIVDGKGNVRFEYDPLKKKPSTKEVKKDEPKKDEPKKELTDNEIINEYDRLYKESLSLGYDLGFDPKVKEFVSKQTGINIDDNYMFEDLQKNDKLKILVALQKMVNAAKAKKGK